MKIAFLLPRSDMFPTLPRDFLNGFKIGISSVPELASTEMDIMVESIGNGADEAVLNKAEQIILEGKADVIVAFCSAFHLSALVKTANSYQFPILVVDLGGNVLKGEHFSPWVLHHSLHLCNAAYMAGSYAATHIGKKGAVISSFYDGGYQLPAAFVDGFVENGGEVVYNFVAPMEYKTTDYSSMLEGIQSNEADVLFGIFSYKESQAVFEFLSSHRESEIPPVMAIPLMTDESMDFPDYGLGQVLSMASWTFSDPGPEMQTFLDEYKGAFKQTANIFSLLGYETYQLLTKMQLQEGAKGIKEMSATEVVGSPRGPLLVNDNNQTEIKQHYLRSFEYNCTAYKNKVIATIPAMEERQLVTHYENVAYTGWLNPYICT